MNSRIVSAFLSSILIGQAAFAGVREEMSRASDFGSKAASLVSRNQLRFWWSKNDDLLIYRVNTVAGEFRFYQVDPATGNKTEAFDHELLAVALAKESGSEVSANKLPLESIEANRETSSVRFRAHSKGWVYSTLTHSLSEDSVPPKEATLLPPAEAALGTKETGDPIALNIENATQQEIEIFWVTGSGEKKSYGKIPPGSSSIQQTFAGHMWLIQSSEGQALAGIKTPDFPSTARITSKVEAAAKAPANLSPDGKWRGMILNHNLVLEPSGGGSSITLTVDGTESDSYTHPLEWSPDSKRIIAFRVKRVEQRKINIVQSSPPDQLQPKILTIDYTKPGDPIRQPLPHLFDVENQREIPLDNNLFTNPWSISEGSWEADSSEYSFVFNERGHQTMRILGVHADSGAARIIQEEKSQTFIDYSQKFFMQRLPETREILWASERDGHNHLYLIDTTTGTVKNQVTRGDWEVREVMDIDISKRTVLLKLVGMKSQDPYHEHFARVNFDGTGFTHLTTGDGDHKIAFSPGRKYFTDTWSRVDQPAVVELRLAEDGKLIAKLEEADDSALRKTGWSRPERFAAKGRDGKTDIHGIIIRPLNFDPSKKYPVVEDIYAGPHDHFVPKSYFTWNGKNAMAELGFVVVSIDGMGTNWRGKAFHDVCYKNLMDAGLPDRIRWIKAAAAERPWMDLNRVGIYGGSAGGQSTLSALLHHGDFYKVGVADCGCHDNRMDKIWWNEAWMGWPVDESYERNSNVTHAANLQGELLLIVGELDTNVDPASTAQVVGALQNAGKDFEYLPVINAGHGAAETPYGSLRRAEFLHRHLTTTPTGQN